MEAPCSCDLHMKMAKNLDCELNILWPRKCLILEETKSGTDGVPLTEQQVHVNIKQLHEIPNAGGDI